MKLIFSKKKLILIIGRSNQIPDIILLRYDNQLGN